MKLQYVSLIRWDAVLVTNWMMDEVSVNFKVNIGFKLLTAHNCLGGCNKDCNPYLDGFPAYYFSLIEKK